MRTLKKVFSKSDLNGSVEKNKKEAWRDLGQLKEVFEEKHMSFELPEAIQKYESAVRASEFWPTHPLWRDIGADFGRAHYIFPGGSVELARLVHIYCYRREGSVSDTERAAFFKSLGIDNSAAPIECNEVTPVRNRIIARVKFELVRRYLAETFPTWSPTQVTTVATTAMYFSTQGPLGYAKMHAWKLIQKQFPNDEKPQFALFRTVINAEPETSSCRLQVTFLNCRPAAVGAWQVNYTVKKHARKYMIVFEMDLLRPDRGSLTVKFKKEPQEEFSADEKAKLYGIWIAGQTPPRSDYDASTAAASSTASSQAPVVLRYCDTTPTF